jgi:hypothetical protein
MDIMVAYYCTEAKKRFIIDKSTLSASEGKEKSEFQIQDPESPQS